eukprot:TRINITY_DN26678_c0_g1_i1.p1 TRINITY_DN26678_c0_g1~~TRINITY_DN26678_c0_g1_i1.p1  ORF type:complete len:377 (-),score=38.48 TRINITY_DN26678_c0_g1_i1:554-1639(-)
MAQFSKDVKEKLCIFGAGLVVGVTVLSFGQYLQRRRLIRKQLENVYELNGLHYQEMGHAWCHEAKDFKVLYRPVYHCVAAEGRFEAHRLAVSPFPRWESKFRRLNASEVPAEIAAALLPGPFYNDPEWIFAEVSHPLPAASRHTRSALGSTTRSHEPPLLEHIIGDYRTFISLLHSKLAEAGLDAISKGFEMDHICFRCESVTEYQNVLQALVPRFGERMIESMIGGRPIATVLLHQPICHAGYKISCLEVPCPKPGRAYSSGLEHAELVVGKSEDGMHGHARLLAFMEECRAEGVRFQFDTSALKKSINADVSTSFSGLFGAVTRDISVKFHQRPLYEVVRHEIQSGLVESIPAGYFEKS